MTCTQVVLTGLLAGEGCNSTIYYCDGGAFFHCVLCGHTHVISGTDEVAVLDPVKGQSCFGSKAVLGNQLPANTTDTAHEITNIQAVWAPVNGGTVDVAGWIYSTGPGGATDHWFQLNTGFSDFWNAVANNLPGLDVLAKFITDQQTGYSSMTDPAAKELEKSLVGQNGYAASCFKRSLL